MNKIGTIAVSSLFLSLGACSADVNEHRPVYSPDGKKVVYMSMSDKTGRDWELYLMNADGSKSIRLTDHEGWDGYAVWAPDGSTVIFDREDSGNKTPHVYDLESGQVRALGIYDGWMAVNDWSADGSTLLGFHEVAKQRDLYLLDVEGNVVRKLTDTPDYNEHDAHFSPDGSRVAYANGPTEGSGSSLELLDLGSGIVTVAVRSAGGIYGVAWSPSGDSIAYTDNPPGGDEDDADVFLLTIGTGEVRQLTTNDAWDHMPEFHPGGKSLLFTSYRSGNERMYQIDLDSGEIKQLKPAGSI